MRFYYPDYYRKFQCIAGGCRDSCCIGWEIDIDPDTESFYRSVKGDFGRRLSESISGGCFVLAENDRCPFLNGTGLCDIYTELGEEHLCQICSDHPRYYEWFGDIKEGGIGLCCEAAADLILSVDHRLTFEEVSDEECDEYDPELFRLLYAAREIMIEQLQSNDLPVSIAEILSFAESLQASIDSGKYAMPERGGGIAPEKADIQGIFQYLTTLEPINEKWIPYIRERMAYAGDCAELSGEDLPYIRRIAVYFIYRYFLKGTFDGEILSRVKLAVLSSWTIACLWETERLKTGKCSHEDRVSIAKDYSKEIEYCEENIAALSDSFYELEMFSSSRLAGLFACL